MRLPRPSRPDHLIILGRSLGGGGIEAALAAAAAVAGTETVVALLERTWFDVDLARSAIEQQATLAGSVSVHHAAAREFLQPALASREAA